MGNILKGLFGKKPPPQPTRDVMSITAHLPEFAIQVVAGNAASRSYFGGAPHLPVGIDWPKCQGKPLTFLARLSLSDLNAAHRIEWLPTSGALLFFYDVDNQPWGFDPKDRGGWAVLHVPDLSDPVRQPQPSAPQSADTLPHRNVRFRPIVVYPSWERDPVQALALTETEVEEYLRIGELAFGGKPSHQVSGFPTPVQRDSMELECQLASHGVYCGDAKGYESNEAAALRGGASDWRLLFQIAADDDFDAMWGDEGNIYFWVQEREARASQFENVWLVLQCG
jgi:uncharacterized protein YwqG